MKFIYYTLAILFMTTGLYSQSDSIPRVKEFVVVSNDVGSSTVLEFGLDSLASDDFDFQFGEANLPPLPPPTAWDTRLLLPEGGFSGVKSSFKDYRNAPSFPFTGSKEHRIQYQVGTGTTITINWNFPPQVSGLLQDIVTGTLINVPMSDSGSYTVAQPNIFNKLKFTVNYAGVIPVELTSFSAMVNGSSVNLNWQTATELNNSGFEIERRKTQDEKSEDWESIGFVAGNGTTTETQKYSFTDQVLSLGNYSYRIKQIDFDGSFAYSNILEVNLTTPVEFVLNQNYPNPFNPSTTINFAMPEAGNIKLKVFDLLGQEVKTLVNEYKDAGTYTVKFDARELNSGIYIYKLDIGSFTQVRKMMILK